MNIILKQISCKLILFAILLSLLSAGCTRDAQSAYPTLSALVDSVRLKYVPDRRDDVYEITIKRENKRPALRGATTVPAAKSELLERIRQKYPNVIDSITVLPDTTVGNQMYGVINVSAADLRTGADYAAEMATQVLLGMPVQVLQRKDWWRVKTSEGYVAWMEDRQLVRMDKTAFEQWISARKVIFTVDYGFAVETPDENGQRVSDLVYGNLLKWEGDSGRFYSVGYPDGRHAYVLKTQCRLLDGELTFPPLSEAGIVREALALKGIPYTWGGTSAKAMDCSGFVKTVYLKQGIVLRRDASQQALTGIPVDISDGLENLRPGDLLFFGKKATEKRKERIRHVAIYLGGREFIHASGFIRINSLDPTQPHYDRGNAEELVRASRVIGATETNGIWRLVDKISLNY